MWLTFALVARTLLVLHSSSAPTAIMDEDFGDGESEALFCSPLSEPVDTVVLEASSPTLYQVALDMLAIPAMSAECERVFSSA